MIPSGYKEDVVYSQIPTDGSGDLSFTRASNGTRINSAGLVEVCPWNLFQQSENFPNAIWTKSTLTFNSTVTAPNGTSTAQNYSTAGAYSYVLQTITVSSGEYYTVSCYLKYTSGVGSISIGYTDAPSNNFIRVDANLINGTIGSVSYGGNGANGTATITSVGDGWYRVTVSGTLTIGNAGLIVSNLALGATTFSIWGAQLNIGATAKPYFPTTDRLNVPRLTYQNGGGGCPSLLLEKQSTNLLKYSEQFENSNWTKLQGNGGSLPIITENYGISPDGTQNADRIQLTRTTQTSSFSYVYQNYVGTVGVAYSWSVWLKSLSGTPSVALSYDGSIYLNIVTLTTEWQRYTFTSNAINPDLQATFLLFENLSSTSLSADFLAWGAQIEASSYPTSYIHTTSSSATRVADACFKTGISSLIGQTSGVLFVDINRTQKSENYQVPVFIGSNPNIVQLYFTSTNSCVGQVYTSAGQQVAIISSALANGRYKIALAYASNDFAMYINGTQIGTDSSGTVPTCSQVIIGNDDSGASNFNDSINQAILFPTRLTNAELASLTTI
jgi:hypothetical protein